MNERVDKSGKSRPPVSPQTAHKVTLSIYYEETRSELDGEWVDK